MKSKLAGPYTRWMMVNTYAAVVSTGTVPRWSAVELEERGQRMDVIIDGCSIILHRFRILGLAFRFSL